MSSAPDAPAAPAPAHDDHEAFDGEPARELSPGEPRSPGWLPALGAAFFAAAAVYMLTGNDSAAAGAVAAPEAKPSPPSEAVPAPPEAHGPAGAAPGGTAVRKMSPEQVRELQKKIEEARAKGGIPQRPAPARRPERR